MSTEITRLSVELSPSRPNLARHRGWTPRADVYEGPGFVLARFELPGVPASRVHVYYHAERHTLAVRGERPDDDRLHHETLTPYLIELECGAFAREVALPARALDLSAAETSFENGILSVAIPVVEVRAGEGGR